MDKNSTNMNNERKYIGLIKIFANLDTQSAIVAALAISLVTAISAGFVKLCSYIYWSAYFSRFNIPLTYLNEAIKPENETKYILIVLIPIIILLWWIMGRISIFVRRIINAKIDMREKLGVKTHLLKCNTVKVILGLFVVVCCFLFFLVLWSELCYYDVSFMINIFYVEIALYMMIKISNKCFGKHFSLSTKGYVFVRVICVFVALYMILAHVYITGNFDNYSNGAENVKIINSENINFDKLKRNSEYDVDVVLFETSEYYYVINATMKQNENREFQFTVWSNNIYKFVDKSDNPIKTIYGNLWTSGQNTDNALNPNMDRFAWCMRGIIFIFICVLGIPLRTAKQSVQKENC